MMSNMESLLETAKMAAREAGEAVMELYASAEFETKSDGTPVTAADFAANEIILRHLDTTGIPILSEESEGITLPYPDTLWIIDPIDGTQGFIDKSGEFAIMIGLLVNGYPALGVVYAPTQKTIFYAMKGQGAYRENDGVVTKLMVTSIQEAPLRFVRSKNHFTPFMESVAQSLNAVTIPCGGIGIKASLVAKNEGDFFFTKAWLGEWDVCAPSIIMEEAGGCVTDIYGKKLFYGTKNHHLEDGAIFSNGVCHEAVVNAIGVNL